MAEQAKRATGVLRAVEPAAGTLAPEPRGEVYSVRLGDRWTTVRLEPEFKAVLDEICRAEGRSWHSLCAEVARSRGPGVNFASALRIHALGQLRARLPDLSAGQTGHLVQIAELLGDSRNLVIRTDDRVVVGRRELDFDIVQRHAGFNLVYAMWRALARGDEVPAVGRFPLDALREVAGVSELVNIAEVRAADPKDFRLERKAPISTLGQMMPGKTFRHLGEGAYGTSVREAYLAVKQTGRAALQSVAVTYAEAGTGPRQYQRMLLPLREPGVGITRLVVVVDWNSPAVPPPKRR